MKIGITLHPYGEGQPAGLGEYILSLSEFLVKQNQDHQLVFFVKGLEKIEPSFIKGTSHECRKVSKSYFWLDKIFAENQDIDLWIYHNPVVPFLHKPKKSIVIALDFSFLELMRGSVSQLAKMYLHKLIQKRALSSATRIVTISDFTKHDLKYRFPGVDDKKVTSIYAGFRDLTQIKEEPFELPKDFYLTLGVIKPRKNQLRIVKGFIEAKEKGLKGKLVVAGKVGNKYLEEIKEFISKSQFSEDVILPGYLSDAKVIYAYRQAKALAFPSLCEGFGFPVLEAMSLGVPVITSNTTSLDEVAGEAAIKVNPESITEIADSFIKMEKKEVQQKYIELGYKQVEKFSWENTANKMLEVINKI
jgi:glycosyltransferase involved in cell wall biosynthesis